MPSPTTETTLTQTEMDFPEAMRQIIAGKVIHKREWPENDFACLRNQQLQLYRDREWHIWSVSEGDMIGTDYVVL